MRWSFVAFSFLALASGTRSAPHHGKSGNGDASVSLRSTYNRLVKAAAEVEKLTGDASLLTKKKRSQVIKLAGKGFVQDTQRIISDAARLERKAYAVMGKKPPAKHQKSGHGLKAAYREMLAAAKGVELVRRSSNGLTAKQITKFAAEEDPEEAEEAVEELKEDIEEAEEDVEDKVDDLKEAKAAEETADDKEVAAEAGAAEAAADQALAEADHEQAGGHELVGEATGDQEQQEQGAADKADAAAEVEATTADHEAADAAHAEADQVDDAHEEKVDQAEEKLEDAVDEHNEAVEEHNAHPEAEDVEKPEDPEVLDSEESEESDE